MRLHWFWSTNPQKVRLALEALELDYELLTVDLAKGEHKSEQHLAIHPRGKVPALEIDGAVLWESNAALNYLGEREQRLWPDTAIAKAQALNWLYLEAAAFQDPAGQFFYQRVVKAKSGYPENAEKLATAHKTLEPLYRILSTTLENQEYLLGDLSLVDFAYAPWLPLLDMNDYPSLCRWRDRLRKLPCWKACEFIY